MAFLYLCCEYVLILLVSKEVDLANCQEEYSYTGNPSTETWAGEGRQSQENNMQDVR